MVGLWADWMASSKAVGMAALMEIDSAVVMAFDPVVL